VSRVHDEERPLVFRRAASEARRNWFAVKIRVGSGCLVVTVVGGVSGWGPAPVGG